MELRRVDNLIRKQEWIKKNWAELNPAGAVVERRRE